MSNTTFVEYGGYTLADLRYTAYRNQDWFERRNIEEMDFTELTAEFNRHDIKPEKKPKDRRGSTQR